MSKLTFNHSADSTAEAIQGINLDETFDKLKSYVEDVLITKSTISEAVEATYNEFTKEELAFILPIILQG